MSNLPEARNVLNVRGYKDGYSVTITSRNDQDKVIPMMDLADNIIKEMDKRGYKPSWNEVTNKKANGDPDWIKDEPDQLSMDKKLCLIHKVEMRQYQNDEGQKWFSHSDIGGDKKEYWCSGNGWKNQGEGARYLKDLP